MSKSNGDDYFHPNLDYKLLDWIPLDKVLKKVFLSNPKCIKIIEKKYQYLNKNVRKYISLNEAAVHLLEKREKIINWKFLSQNPNPKAINILRRNHEKIDWDELSSNPIVIQFLDENPSFISKIRWDILSENPKAIQLLQQHPDKIYWKRLSANPQAIHLLERNQDKIDWEWLSENPKAIHLLEQNQDKIDWWNLLKNPSIFEIDYQALQQRIEPFKEELIQKCFHPDRLVHYLETYNYDIGEDEYNN